MSYVKVTFKTEVTDENHEIGLTEQDFEELTNEVASLGGYDVEFEKVEGDD